MKPCFICQAPVCLTCDDGGAELGYYELKYVLCWRCLEEVNDFMELGYNLIESISTVNQHREMRAKDHEEFIKRFGGV